MPHRPSCQERDREEEEERNYYAIYKVKKTKKDFRFRRGFNRPDYSKQKRARNHSAAEPCTVRFYRTPLARFYC